MPGHKVNIAVMGATGSGKTRSSLITSSSLESCTRDIQFGNPFELDGYNVTLIDTPGFDDTERSDTEILNLIAVYLSSSYEHGQAQLQPFPKICGDSTLKNVIILTTRWNSVETAEGELRERELSTKDIFFKPVLDLQAQMLRFQPYTSDRAHAILRHIIANQPKVLQIQEELVDRKLSISGTKAGEELNKELREQADRHRKDIEALEDLFRKEHALDAQARAELEAELNKLRHKIKRVDEDAARMASNCETQKREHKSQWDLIASNVRMVGSLFETGKMVYDLFQPTTSPEIRRLEEEIAARERESSCVIL
ncbi:hypothetical protein BD410DRAFT_845111 [Rickenella mellea]|uniref:G domain-containing protein n=1 Tax=Rickenella mellea TaxID=50990 RepID=A0A4Y7PL55_9AGAM|nr:hypothetical protein BD410DRAFT_845111 [Rickenella mellea]